jgi:putative membrane protein
LIAPGFLGTRADLVVDVTLLGVTLSPFILWHSFKSARLGNRERHRKIQTILFLVLASVVVWFEVDVRITSATKPFVVPSPWVNNLWFDCFLAVHISVAVATFTAWLVLGIRSYQAYQKTLPGTFSVNHKRFGQWIFFGLIYTAMSGSIIYVLSFVL